MRKASNLEICVAIQTDVSLYPRDDPISADIVIFLVNFPNYFRIAGNKRKMVTPQ